MIDRERAERATWWKVWLTTSLLIYGGLLLQQLPSGRLVFAIPDIAGSIIAAGLMTWIWWGAYGRRRSAGRGDPNTGRK